jgi:hypothetical protein
VAKLQEIGGFIWPQAIRSRGVTGQKIFAKGDQNEDIKCSASECLSVYSVFRFFLLEALQTQNLRAIRAECESYFRLCHVLDLLQQVKLGKTTPRALEVAVVAHLSAFKDAYQDKRFLPKHHYSLHLCNVASTWDTCVVLVPRTEAQRDQVTCSVDLQHMDRLGEICDGGCRVRHA